MSNLENKVNLLVSLFLAEDDESRASIKKALASEIKEVQSPMSTPKSVQAEAEDLLLELGVPCHLIGNKCLVSALCLSVEKPDILDAITSELYPAVAKIHGSTSSRVERAIRHAIEVCWDRGDMDVFMKYFGNTISRYKGKPTNGEFLSQCTRRLRRRLGM